MKDWPFQEPEIFEAIDGRIVPTPYNWREGGGAWGCMQSHRQILEQAIINKTEPILVMEDDILLCENFNSKIKQFLIDVPDDWEQLMIGGQHRTTPKKEKSGVVRCNNCQRTHAYAIRGKFLRELYAHWCSPNSRVHCDWIMGPLQKNFNVYAPEPFLIGQRSSDSDICNKKNPTNFWIPPTSEDFLALLKCPKELLPELRKKGVHTGFQRNNDDIDVGVAEAFTGKGNLHSRLKRWVDDVMWEVKSDESLLIAACWHPMATLEHLKKCWSGSTFEVEGDTVDQVMKLININKNINKKMFM